jgi:hypothetical protein
MSNEVLIEEAIPGNETIGRWMGLTPELEYYVGKDESSIYNPAHIGDYYITPELQKRECERWLSEHPQQAKDGYKINVWEWWPFYHNDWNKLIPALQKANKEILKAENNNDAVMAIDYALDSYAEFDIIKTWSGLVAFIKAIQPE